jgi:hypothetical protein
MKFLFHTGQRPLEGYTLKRGIGHGGFGEVYYAVSDGGKEVALKIIRDNLDVELRGVAQCLNLKHPNLVDIYDLRKDALGNQWVVMEYVGGEPLCTVFQRHPRGLPAELAQQWFLAFANAVAYLHDNGIVHRDLKPGNIFLENGIIKVGDYGLSKFINGSQKEAQTQSVGTVHYMAPEIGSGNYNKQIDIYAAGIILYEMLSGRVPFDGQSSNEILMKHLTAKPDLGAVAPEYRRIIARALEKDPQKRYASMADMARDVAALTGSRDAAGPRRIPEVPTVAEVKLRPVYEPIPMVREVVREETTFTRLAELSGALALSALLASLSLVVWAAFRRSGADSLDWSELGSLYFQTVLVSWAVLIPAKLWARRNRNGLARRLTMFCMGLLVGLSTLWADGWVVHTASGTTGLNSWLPSGRELAEAAGVLSYFAIALAVMRWWRLADPLRRSRFAFMPVLGTAFWACLLMLVWQEKSAAVSLVLASVIVQLASPWEPLPVEQPARRARWRSGRCGGRLFENEPAQRVGNGAY